MASPNINVLMSLVDKFSAPMREIQNATGETAKKLKLATNGVTKFSDSVAGKLASVTKTVAVGLGGAVAGLGAYSIKVGADFEASMSKVQAISGASGEALNSLTEKAKQLGSTTSLSASQVSEAMQYMAMAGWDTTAINNGIEGLVRLAEASGEELGSVSDIVTDAMTAFKLSSDQVGRFGDVLSATASNANTNVAMMGESFKECSALAGTMGYSIEDISLALGTMANAGIKGSTAGTALKNAISNMASPTKAMGTVMDRLGLSLTDSSGKMKDFRTVMKELRTAFAGLTKEEQASASATLFGKESMAGMLSIINASDADFNKLANAIDNSKGSTEKMAKTMNNNLMGQLKTFKSVMEGIGISIYDKFKEPLTNAFASVNERFQELAQSISGGDLGQKLAGVGDSFGKMATVIGNVLVTVMPAIIDLFGFIMDNGDTIVAVLAGIAVGFEAFKIANTLMALKTAIGGVSIATATLNAIMSVNPMVWVAVAIGAVIAGLVYLALNFDKVKNEVQYVWDKIKEFGNGILTFFQPALEAISEKISPLKEKFTEMVNAIVNSPLAQFLIGVFQGFIGLITGAGEAVSSFASGFMAWLQPVIDFMSGVFSVGINIAIGTVIAVFEGLLGSVSAVIDGIITAIGGVMDFITGVFTGNWEQAWNGVQNIFTGVFDAITGVFSGFVDGLLGGLGRVIDKAKEAIGLGGSAGATPEHNATGTDYFKGGQTYVNENNRGELINLPSGSQIIPHDLAVKAVSGSGQNININLTVQGNVIGNEDFYNECGRAITAKLGTALANM